VHVKQGADVHELVRVGYPGYVVPHMIDRQEEIFEAMRATDDVRLPTHSVLT
jgi:hypothetical protein